MAPRRELLQDGSVAAGSGVKETEMENEGKVQFVRDPDGVRTISPAIGACQARAKGAVTRFRNDVFDTLLMVFGQTAQYKALREHVFGASQECENEVCIAVREEFEALAGKMRDRCQTVSPSTAS